MPNTYTVPTMPNVNALAKQFETIPGIDGSAGQSLGGVGSGFEKSNPPPPAFADQCKRQGGAFGGSIYDRTQSGVPTSEQGWTCQTPGNKCFDLLTYSGAEYQGGQSGCPQQGLIPARPINNIFRNGGGGKSPATPTTSAPSAPTWDGTYTTAASTATCVTDGTLPDGTPYHNEQKGAGQPMTFAVSGNTAPGGVHISPSGQTTFSVPVGGSVFTETLTFVHDTNGGVHFSGTGSYTSKLGGGRVYNHVLRRGLWHAKLDNDPHTSTSVARP